MGKYNAYEKYKDSGVEWLGEIPEHWHQKRLKFSVDLVNNKIDAENSNLPYMGLEHIESWTGKRITDDNALSEGVASHFRPDDVLFGKLRPYLAKVYLSEIEGLASTEALVLRSKEDIFSKFLKYYVLSRDFINIVDSSTFGAKMPRASWDFIGNLFLTIPPLPEQQTIANFLDYKTKQIDALITKKETLLEKLDEKRTAIISHAVTKGLDPNVPMKDSGIEWLGEIPEHWEVIQIKRAFILQRGVDITQENQTEGVIPVVSSGGIASYHNVAYAKPPGVLVGRKGTIGNVHYVEVDYWPHDTTLWVIEFYNNNPRFIYYKLLSMNLQDWDTGSANPTLNRNLIHPLRTSWPSSEEQEEIVDYLDKNTTKIDQQKAKIQQAINLLKEYRTALITNAVTGKIDVRQVSIP